ncbi:ATP-binding domain-containing protein [Jiangella asiatica]|uniref:UvrD-like helicase C-terminal domain-containing protein n=1 Tax=Jiangella asiatica TaxID=2530372 RepID=A0A4R5DGX4_9ACTN|nr:ATP-binding domain-containing protein [Jiangella asiatica]TDE09703.1 hypothetical protein E1269_13845 [Jiangella asiatica]
MKNGDRWIVTTNHGDGALTVRRADGRWRGTVTLPSWYVAEHVDLGYAITAHRARGATVDAAHVVVRSPAMTREALYVAMTRGRHKNIAYVATDRAPQGAPARRRRRPDGALAHGVSYSQGRDRST